MFSATGLCRLRKHKTEANIPLNEYDRLQVIFEATSYHDSLPEHKQLLSRREVVAGALFLPIEGSGVAKLTTISG